VRPPPRRRAGREEDEEEEVMTIEMRNQLERILVRKEHALCTQCFTIEPIHPGDGTPATAFISALELMAYRHRECKPANRGKEKR